MINSNYSTMFMPAKNINFKSGSSLSNNKVLTPIQKDTFVSKQAPNITVLSFKGLSQGGFQINTGDGKGKTTAAMGEALRAIGQGLNVKIIQFCKGPKTVGNGDSYYGEYNALTKYIPKDLLSIEQFGLDHLITKANLNNGDRKEFKKGWEIAKDVLTSGKHDLVILDELNIALDLGLVSLKEVKDFIKSRPDNVELLITGRRAHPEIIEMANVVTEMKPIKHHFDNTGNEKVQARAGIDY